MKRRESIFSTLSRVAFAASIAVAACISTVAADDSKITIIAEWIELELADLHQLTAGEDRLPLGGDELRKAVTGLIAENRAEVIHTSIVNTRSGQRAQAEGVGEVIYPTQFIPPTANASGEGITNAMPTAFETRNTGPTLEVDPVLKPGGKTVDFRFAAEIVTHFGQRSYGKDEAESKVPDFYNMEIVSQLTGKSGHYRLAGTFRPHAPMGEKKRKDPRLMLFLRANVNPVNPPEIAASAKGAIQDPKAESTLAFHFEFIETEMALMNELLIDKQLSTRGPQLRNALVEAIDEGRATLIDSVVASGQAGGERPTVVESGLELIFPTEWDEAAINENGTQVIPATPAAFETVQLGSVISFTSEFTGGDIQLDLLSELSNYVSEQKYFRDESEVSFPLNHFARLAHRISLWPGETAFAGTVRPDKPAQEGRKDPVIAIFVRGEVADPDVPPNQGSAEKK